jgi:hypothetical protein
MWQLEGLNERRSRTNVPLYFLSDTLPGRRFGFDLTLFHAKR